MLKSTMPTSMLRRQLTLQNANQRLSSLQRQHQRFKSTINGGSDRGAHYSFQNLWQRYTAALIKNPLLIKGSTASFIFFSSDSATQYLTEPDSPYNLARAGSGAAFGVVATFWLHYWWNFLEGFIGRRVPAEQSKLTNTLVKVILDQALAAPCYIYGYYVITNFIQDYSAQQGKHGKDAAQVLDETSHRAGEMLFPTMLRHWTLWPAVHSLNFYFNPLHHRVLVQNLVLVGWSGYLSHLNNGGLMTPKDEIEVTIKRQATIRQDTHLPKSVAVVESAIAISPKAVK